MYMYMQKNLMITTKLVNICSIVYMYFNRFYNKVNNIITTTTTKFKNFVSSSTITTGLIFCKSTKIKRLW